jgi:anti-sigma B factor antagonist
MLTTSVRTTDDRVPLSTVTERPETDPPPFGLDIVHHEVDGLLVIAVAGEIDMETAPALYKAVTAGIDRTRGEPCVLDLTMVTFLGSAGLSALVEATSIAEARREPLRIVVDSNRPVIRPIQVTGLDDVLRLYHSVDEAVRAGNPR